MEAILLAAVVLALVCLGLGLRVYAVERSLRRAARQLEEQARSGSTARILMAAPNAAAEDLLGQVNRLLELRQADEARYQERERELRRQIANVSHDLRTPLTSILGYLQLLEGDTLTAQERGEYLTIIEGRARALQSLITSFYDLSRLEGGEYPLKREQVDLYSVLSSLLAAFYGDLEQAGFEVSVELQEGLPAVWGDSGGVLRVFTNLIRNAMDHGSGRLEIRLYRERDSVVSSFTNDAGGLTQEDAEHVFERFFTSDKNRTGRNTGLGLAIVKALVGQMGHQVSAFLREGRFTIAVGWKMPK